MTIDTVGRAVSAAEPGVPTGMVPYAFASANPGAPPYPPYSGAAPYPPYPAAAPYPRRLPTRRSRRTRRIRRR